MMDQTTVYPSTMTTQNIDPRLIAMFSKAEGSVGVQGSFTHFVQPTRNPAPNDMEYVLELPNMAADYVDLKNIELYVRGKLTRADGTALVKDELVVLANNALHSLFESVTVLIGHNQQEIQMNNYPHKAYLRQLMSNKTVCPAARGHGFTAENSVQNFDTANQMRYGIRRYGWTSLSKNVDFLGPTFIDVFQTEGYLMPATPLRITFKRSREEFYLTTDTTNGNVEYLFSIDKIGLYVPTLKVAPYMTPLLEMQTDEVPARYRFDSIDARRFPLPKDTLTHTYSRVYQGKIPSKMAIAFYRQDAFTGSRDRAALITPELDIRRVQMAVNGLVVREHVVNFGEALYMESFRRFTDWMGATTTDYLVDHRAFYKGVTFFTFDMIENCQSMVCSEESLLTGFVDISLQFGLAVPAEMLMVVFAISPDVLDISKERAARYTRTIV